MKLLLIIKGVRRQASGVGRRASGVRQSGPGISSWCQLSDALRLFFFP